MAAAALFAAVLLPALAAAEEPFAAAAAEEAFAAAAEVLVAAAEEPFVAAAEEEKAFAAAEVLQQGFFPGSAAVHLAAGQLEILGVVLELVQLEVAGASVLLLEQALGDLAFA